MPETLLERLTRTLAPTVFSVGLVSLLALPGQTSSSSRNPPETATAQRVLEEPPAPRWSFTPDEAYAHFNSVRDTTYRVPAWRSERMSTSPSREQIIVVHTTGEGTCESNRDFLRGIRGRRRIPPLAHVLICEDGTWYDLAHRDRVTTGLGRASSLDGDTLAFKRAYNIEVQGTPWERRTEAQRATLKAFFAIEEAEGRYADSRVFAHALLAAERSPYFGVRMTGRKPDGITVLAELGILLRSTSDAFLNPVHDSVFALERAGLLTQESFNDAFGYLGTIEGNLAWRVPRGGSAYPMLSGEFASASALYFFPSTNELVSGAELRRATGGVYGALARLPQDAIVVHAPRNKALRDEQLPQIVSLLAFRSGRQNDFFFDPNFYVRSNGLRGDRSLPNTPLWVRATDD